jgi:glycosyltransferase involved in cell wall biosynthesis
VTAPVLDIYTCLWNEARLLPFFLAHYGPVCRRIVALDDGSDDGTVEILAAHPKVETRRMPEERHSWVLASTRWWNEVWKESRDADWVGIVVTDEIVGPDLATSLAAHQAAGHTVLKPRGFDMVAESFNPVEATRGVYNAIYSKPCLFRPDRITGIALSVGNHDCAFEGEVVLCEPDDLAFRHYRYLGREETWERYQQLEAKRRPGDRANKWGGQYEMSREEFDRKFDDMLTAATPVHP